MRLEKPVKRLAAAGIAIIMGLSSITPAFAENIADTEGTTTAVETEVSSSDENSAGSVQVSEDGSSVTVVPESGKATESTSESDTSGDVTVPEDTTTADTATPEETTSDETETPEPGGIADVIQAAGEAIVAAAANAVNFVTGNAETVSGESSTVKKITPAITRINTTVEAKTYTTADSPAKDIIVSSLPTELSVRTVTHTYICIADTEEIAKDAAEKYGITLLSYAYKVAVFDLGDKSLEDLDALKTEYNLPELSVNSSSYTTKDTSDSESTETEAGQVGDDVAVQVTWDSEDYEQGKAGTYTFKSKLTDSRYSARVALPTCTVTVTEAKEDEETPVTPTTDDFSILLAGSTDKNDDGKPDGGFATNLVKAATNQGKAAGDIHAVRYIKGKTVYADFAKTHTGAVSVYTKNDAKAGISSDKLTWAWFDEAGTEYAADDAVAGTVWILSEAETVYVNSYESYMFYDLVGDNALSELEMVDLSGLNWQNTKLMYRAFYKTESLQNIDLSTYNLILSDQYGMYKMFENSGIESLTLSTSQTIKGHIGLTGNWTRTVKDAAGNISAQDDCSSYVIEVNNSSLSNDGATVTIEKYTADDGIIKYHWQDGDTEIESVHTENEYNSATKTFNHRTYQGFHNGDGKNANNVVNIHDSSDRFTGFCINELVNDVSGYYVKELYTADKEQNGYIEKTSAAGGKYLGKNPDKEGYFDIDKDSLVTGVLGDTTEETLIALLYWGPKVYSVSSEEDYNSGSGIEGQTRELTKYEALQSDIWHFTDGADWTNEQAWKDYASSNDDIKGTYPTFNDIPNKETYVLYVYVNQNDKQNIITTESIPQERHKVVISKTNISGSKELAGASLYITDTNGNEVWKCENTDGKTTNTAYLEAGTYTLTEKSAPTGYEKAESITFKIDENGDVYIGDEKQDGSKVVMKDDYKLIGILIKKVDENGTGLGDKLGEDGNPAKDKDGNPSETNAQLKLETIESITESKISKDFYIDAEGMKAKLWVGVYKISELKAPDGYTIADPIYFEIKADGSVYLVEANEDGTVKKDSEGNTVTKGGKLTIVTDGNDQVAVISMIDKKDTTKYDVQIAKTDMYGVKEDETTEKGYKVTEIAGANLKITDESGTEVDSWTSVEGKTHKVSLVRGTYTLTETNAPDGYKIAKDIVFTVGKNGEVTSTKIDDKNSNSYSKLIGAIVMMDDFDRTINISKQDIAGKEIAGAKLVITDKDGNKVEEWTSKEGETHKVELEAGTYTLTETTSPSGYKKAEAIKFTVADNGDVTSDNAKYITKADGKQAEVFEQKDGTYNTKKDGSGTSYKAENVIQAVVMVDESDTHEVVISKTDINGTKEIGGAMLKITHEEKTADGKKEVKDDSWKSVEGESHKTSLAPGTYKLTETLPPTGYTTAESITFKVGDDGTVEVTSKTGEYKNGKVVMKDAQTVVKIKKVRASNSAGLSGAKLQILDSSGNVVDGCSWTSTTAAKTIKGKLKEGATYTLHEVSAPTGYELADDIKFTVTSSEQTITMEDEAKTTTKKTTTTTNKTTTTPKNTTTTNDTTTPSTHTHASDTTPVDTTVKTETPSTTQTEEVQAAEAKTVKNRSTGDASNLPLWIGLGVLAAGGIGTAIVVKKKKGW